MPAPDMRAHLGALVGQTLPTITGKPNRIVGLRGASVLVATAGNPAGAPVSISLLQSVVDRVFEGEEVVFDPQVRSAFVGAVLLTMEQVEVLEGPRRARLHTPSPSNPDWQFDELILALDLYLRWRPRQPPSGHPDLVALSALLRRLPIHPPDARAESFRNVNSVRRKLGDFTDPDPEYTGKPTKGGEGVHLVWARFADEPNDLTAAVTRITATGDGDAPLLAPEEDEAGAVEGRILFRQHRVRERDPGLVRKKKQQSSAKVGGLGCEVCGLDFGERYGVLGEGFIECHHMVPLADAPERKTRTDDLALVCSNCHRMLHRSRPMLSVADLRDLVMRRTQAPRIPDG
jgi:5-methylcytosine-specific restriction enzyme A